MTSQGSAYARFRRALNTGNLTIVLAAAAELPQVNLDDALRMCLVMRDADHGLYERAVIRWLGRFCLEARHVALTDLRRAAEAFADLPNQPDPAMESLTALCQRYGLQSGG